jgi:DNA-binding transcriptional LysR family regulator
MSYKMDAAKRAGKLAIVLEEFEPEALPVHVIYAQRKPVPLKLRVFLNWMTPRLKARLWHGLEWRSKGVGRNGLAFG